MHTTAILHPAASNPAQVALVAAGPAEQAPSMAVVFGAGFTTLSASFINYLVHEGYPLLNGQVALAQGTIGAICAFASLLYLGSGMTVRRVMEGALIALLVDINLAEWQWSVTAGAITIVALMAFRRSALRHLSTFGAIVAAVVMAGSPFADGGWISDNERVSASVPAAVPSGRPAVVHVVFDEHIGLGGLPSTQEGRNLAGDLSRFYAEQGFQTWPYAYSRHLHTINAIPDMLNFGEGLALQADSTGMVVGDTAYFKRLRQLDYRMTIYQSTFGDFCSGARPARCVEYNASSPTPILGVGLSVGQQAYQLVTKFLSLAKVLRPVEKSYERLFIAARNQGASWLPLPSRYARASTGVAALEVMHRVTADLADASPGEAYFVHALIPHYPYVADRDCTIKTVDEWLHRRDWRSITERQVAYFEQIRCTQRLIGRLVAALDKSPAGGNYVLVLHGDHGSRITETDPKAANGPIAAEDFVAGFSTLFAVKFADRAQPENGQVELAVVPASKLLRELALTDFKALSVTSSVVKPTVFLDDREWKPREERDFLPGW